MDGCGQMTNDDVIDPAEAVKCRLRIADDAQYHRT